MDYARGMPMIEVSTAQGDLGARIPSGPSRLFSKAAGPFTFHGHRLSSLYRDFKRSHNPFIFPKILITLSSMAFEAFEYLKKDERRAVHL